MMNRRWLPLALLTGLSALVMLPLANAGPFRLATQYGQTQEPPLFGQPPPRVQIQPPYQPPYQPPPYQPSPYQPPPYQPAPYQPPPQWQKPVPVVPAPFLPQQSGPACPTCPPVDPPAPVVTIKVRVVACAPAGQEIEYRITVENCSAAPAHHVLVRDPVPANARYVNAIPTPAAKDPDLVWVFGTLAPGACKEICLVLAPLDDTDVKNCARVQFEHGQCVTTRIAKAPPGVYEPPPKDKEPPKDKPKGPPKVETPEDGKLKVKITGPARQYANLPAKYQITVANTGDTVATDVLISALLPDKAILENTGGEGREQFGVVAWLAGNIPPGGSKTVQLSYRVPAAGEACLKATAQSRDGGKGEAQKCTDFEGVSALHLEVRDSKDPVEVGGDMSYRITLVNQGTAPLTNVNVRALVPLEMAAVGAKGPSAAPDKLPPPQQDGQLVVFAPLKELKPGEQKVYEIAVKAVKPGDARFRATVTADQLMAGGPVIEEESTQVFREDDPVRPMPPPAQQTKGGRWGW